MERIRQLKNWPCLKTILDENLKLSDTSSIYTVVKENHFGYQKNL